MSAISRRNRISGQFAARLIEMLESPAYRALSVSGHKVISRIEIELAHHGGNENGRLPVTTNDFVEYGMHRTSVAPGIREAEALGFIRITERGRGGNAEYRTPNLFFLTYAQCRDSGKHPPTHDWRVFNSVQEAEEAAQSARNNKDPRAVEHGKSSWHKRQQKPKADMGDHRNSIQKIRIDTSPAPVLTSETTGSGEDLVPLSIARMGGSAALSNSSVGSHDEN